MFGPQSGQHMFQVLPVLHYNSGEAWDCEGPTSAGAQMGWCAPMPWPTMHGNPAPQEVAGRDGFRQEFGMHSAPGPAPAAAGWTQAAPWAPPGDEQLRTAAPVEAPTPPCEEATVLTPEKKAGRVRKRGGRRHGGRARPAEAVCQAVGDHKQTGGCWADADPWEQDDHGPHRALTHFDLPAKAPEYCEETASMTTACSVGMMRVPSWGEGKGWGEARSLIENPEVCNQVMQVILPTNPEVESIAEWLLPDLKELSVGAQCTSRVVQKLLENVGCACRDRLVEALTPHTLELIESQNGNHVLTKAVEVIPSEALQTIIKEIERAGFAAVAKHRYGCRVLERLIEHCSEKEMGALNAKFVSMTEELCRHQYGNFVLQHLLEHGSEARKATVVNEMLPYIAKLATHRTASHVVQRAMNYAAPEGQKAIVYQLLVSQSPASLTDIAVSRYGSYVVEELLSMRCPLAKDYLDEARRRLAGLDEKASPFWTRVAERFGFVTSPGAAGPDASAVDQ